MWSVGIHNVRSMANGGAEAFCRGRNPKTLTAIRSVPVKMKVFRTPNSGMSRRAGKNEPRMLPIVDKANRRPAVFPLESISFTASRTAQGLTAPMRVTGKEKRNKVPNIPPTTVKYAMDAFSRVDPSRSGRRAWLARRRMGWAMNGMSKINAAAMDVTGVLVSPTTSEVVSKGQETHHGTNENCGNE